MNVSLRVQIPNTKKILCILSAQPRAPLLAGVLTSVQWMNEWNSKEKAKARKVSSVAPLGSMAFAVPPTLTLVLVTRLALTSGTGETVVPAET